MTVSSAGGLAMAVPFPAPLSVTASVTAERGALEDEGSEGGLDAEVEIAPTNSDAEPGVKVLPPP